MTAMSLGDPYRSLQWSLDALGAGSLPAPTDRASHLVAVVDSGVRSTHEDFSAGQVRCDLGADFTSEALGPCVDRVGHGTHVAGIIGAVAGNGKGVASLAPGTSILPVRVLDSTGSGGSIAVSRGIVHAVDKGARVINLSLGGPGGSSDLDAAVQYATSRGALVVVSAGNNRMEGNAVNYPAASPGALSVASTEQSGSSSPSSYSGPSVDIAAPGGGIASLWATSDRAYASASGTSMAAPAVSAAASLYRAAYPSATPDQVTAALLATATDLETAGRDDNTGVGLVNPSRLLAFAPTAPATPSPGTSTGAAPTSPAPTTPIETAPIAPAPVAPAPVSPPVQPPVVAPAPATPPAPGAHLKTPRVARGQAASLALRHYRPASTVTVIESWTETAKVRVMVGGRSTTQTRTTPRSKVLGTFLVPANGSVDAKVLPVQGVRSGTLVVRGVDRAGKAVQTTAPLRVG
jgi:subtilisin family serine protease